MKLKGRTLLILVLALLLLGSACNAIPDSFFPEPSPTPTAVRNVLATYQPRQVAPPSPFPPMSTPTTLPTMVAQATLTMMETKLTQPTALPTPPAADAFCCLRFAAGPYAEAKESFPTGTEIIYAVWDYAGLSPGDRIRRIWIRDNLIWITREETWDWDKYGAQGTVRDLSIFDFEGSGLQSAEYRLQIYLNDELQQDSAFVILPP